MGLLRLSTILAILLVNRTLQLPQSSKEDESNFNLDAYGESEESATCTTKDGDQGVCVNESVCNEDHIIEKGGIIDSSEFRELGAACLGSLVWCCKLGQQIDIPEARAVNVDSCLPADGDISPWTVSLFKVANSTDRSAQAAFCLGTLIGSKVILTAGTCLAAARHLTVYAKLPQSNEPTKTYTVRFRKAHPQYNTGSHEFDFGLLVLNEEVTFGDKKVQGACLAFEKPHGQCVAYGIDANENIVTTVVDIQKGDCDSFGGKTSIDRVCTKNADEVCLVATGSSVACQSKKSKKAVVFGVARTTCVNDQVLVGDLKFAMNWITEELTKMKISQTTYLES